MNKWNAELTQLSHIFQSMDLEGRFQWGTTIYYHNGEMVVAAGGFKNYFSVWFYKGVFLSDPLNKLINAQEGKTKGLRQWRFTSAAEIDVDNLRKYIEEAIQIAKEKRNLPKSESIEIEPLFAQVLQENRNLKDKFNTLPPYKQKEYHLHFKEAKRETTKKSRIEKAIPLILQGIGLHDKYKK